MSVHMDTYVTIPQLLFLISHYLLFIFKLVFSLDLN